MRISEVFIRRPVMTFLVMIAVSAFGVMAYRALPVSDLPNVNYPSISVEATYPGASALTMASTVAAPLEKHFMQIAGLEQIYSKSLSGYTVVVLTFALSRDLNGAAQDVQAAINEAMSDLPDDLPAPPTYSKINPSDKPIIYLMVSSKTLTLGQLYRFGADQISRRLSTIPGVARVKVWGSKPALRIRLNPDLLAARGLTLEDVAAAVGRGSLTIPAGVLEGRELSLYLEPRGQLTTAEEFNSLVIATKNGAPIYLKDIGRAVESLEQANIDVRSWRRGGEIQTKVVTLAVYREPTENTVAVTGAIKKALPQIRKELPGALDLEVIYDRAEPIIASVDDVKSTLLIAFGLVVVVIFLFLGRIRDTIIPALALPVSLLATFIVMYALDFSLDLLSLMSLTLAVGFLVDDAIVAMENTVRHVEQGAPPHQAALIGAREIGGTIASMTLSLAAVFIPLVFMPGIIGRVFREFSVTIVAAIICSGLVSLTLTPMLCGRMLKPRRGEPGPLERFSNLVVGFFQNIYLAVLKQVLRFSPAAILIWIGCLVGTGFLFQMLPLTFLPKGDSGAIMGEINAADGTGPELMRAYQGRVQALLNANPYVERAMTITGLGGSLGANKGFLFVVLVPHKVRQHSTKHVVHMLQPKLLEIPGAMTFLGAVPVMDISFGGVGGGGGGGEYSFTLKASDPNLLYHHARAFVEKVRRLPGLENVQTSLNLNNPQLEIDILHDRAASLGVSTAAVERALFLAFSGYKVTTIKSATDEYKVILELGEEFRRRPENLTRIHVRSATTGRLVPLDEVVEWRRKVGPREVRHLDRLNVVTISFDLAEGAPIGQAVRELEKLAAATLPPEIITGFQGEAQVFEKTIQSMGFLVILALLIMYLVLGGLYESYIHPITVLAALPVAGFGGLLALLVFESELSLYAFIGLFLLMGIVKKNGIMLVDFANQKLAEGGVSRREAIFEACRNRFRPIVMTGLCAIMGALPIALGLGADGSARQPLGLTVVGGLIFSQLITLFITPVIYLYLEAFQEKVLYRFAFFRPPAKDDVEVGTQPKA